MRQKQTIRIALGVMLTENVLVRLRTTDGLVGWGESSPYPAVMGETQASDIALAKQLASLVMGRDPFTIPKIAIDLDKFTPANPGIKAAFEMALWDICGKLSHQPVCHMLGQFRDSFLTDLTIFLDTPQVMAEKAKQVVNRGFKVIKVKVGQAPDLDIQRIDAVRAAVGPNINLRIDANQGWTVSEAVRALKELERFRIEFCEQPVPYWDWDGLKFVRERSPIAIMADESIESPHDAIEAVRRGACDMMNVKLMKTGGIWNAMRVVHVADAANMTCMVGCMSETRVALTAAAHVVAASPNVLYADLDAFVEFQTDPVIGGMELRDGTIRVPDSPGLGIDIDSAFLAELRAA
jgi:L-alanine-DL-glutamate epimerase-like enolase superfamily enzyme